MESELKIQKDGRKADEKPEGTSDKDTAEKKERTKAFTARVKSAIRSSIQDGEY